MTGVWYVNNQAKRTTCNIKESKTMNDWLVMEIYAKFHESVSICTPLTLTNQVFKTKPFFCTSTGLHGSDCLWISTEKLPCNWKRCNVLKDEATSYGKRSYSMANYLSPPPMRLGHHCVELYIKKKLYVFISPTCLFFLLKMFPTSTRSYG